jgi:hypothetical protein
MARRTPAALNGSTGKSCEVAGALVVFFAGFQVPKIAVVLDRHRFDSTQKSRYP